MCFLTRRWAGHSAGTSRTGPWVLSCPSGASRIIKSDLFIWHSRGGHAILHKGYCLLSLLSECSCVQFIIILATQVFSCVYDIICFIFAMRFGNTLDKTLQEYQYNLVCLFSSEAESAVGLKPGEHFNYNHSITTLWFKVTGWIAARDFWGWGGWCMPTITCNDPLIPCYSTHSWCSWFFMALLCSKSSLLITENHNIIILRKNIFSHTFYRQLLDGAEVLNSSL